MMTANLKTLVEKVVPWAVVATAIAGVVFGVCQIKINDRLVGLGDYVAISAALDAPRPYAVLYNTGKVNLFLAGFRMDGRDLCYRESEPRLMPVGVGKDAAYQILLPEIKHAGQAVQVRLYLTDQFNRKWISEHKIRVDSPNRSPETGKVDSWNTRVWSLPTFRANWSAHYPPNATSRDGETIEGATFDP